MKDSKILIVDDAEFMRFTLKRILNKHGFNNIVEAGDGKEAVEVYFKEKPDLVTMDITMPIMDGIAATKEICSKDPNALIVIVSAAGQKDKVLEAIKAGAKYFIVKPFKEEFVIETIMKFLTQKKGG